MATVQSLKNTRAGLKGYLRRGLDRLTSVVETFPSDPNAPPLTSSDREELDVLLERTYDSLSKYLSSHLQVLALSPIPDGEIDPEDSDIIQVEERYYTLEHSVRQLTAGVRVAPVPKLPAVSMTPAHSPSPIAARPTVKTPPILEEDIDIKQFLQWKELWLNYAQLVNLNVQPHDRQLATFWSLCSPGFLNMVRRVLAIQRDTLATTDELLVSITDHLRSKRNPNLDWKAFLSVRQRDNQSIDTYYTALMERAEYADVEHVTPDKLRTAVLVLGLADNAVQRKVLAKSPPLNLLDTLKFLQTEESAKDSIRLLGSNVRSDTLVNTVQSADSITGTVKHKPNQQQYNKGKSTRGVKSSPETSSTSPCQDCGYMQHYGPVCPAVTSYCSRCGKKGHLGRVCGKPGRSTPVSPVKSMNTVHTAVVQSTHARVSNHVALPTVNVIVQQGTLVLGTVPAVCDTGAQGTIAGMSFLTSIGKTIAQLESFASERYVGVDNRPLSQAGTLELTFVLSGRSVTTRVVICHDVSQLYLSLDVSRQLNLIHQDFPKPISDLIPSATTAHFNPNKHSDDGALPDDVFGSSSSLSIPPLPSNQHSVAPSVAVDDVVFGRLERREWISSLSTNPSEAQRSKDISKLKTIYAHVFHSDDALPTMSGPLVGDAMNIELKEGAIPFAVRAARQIPFIFREKVKAELDHLEQMGIITPVGDEPVEWCHPMVVVGKPDKGVRICIDLTKLNKQVKRTLHPCKTPAEAVTNIDRQSSYFTLLDAKSGYWQMPLAAEAQKLTTFITPWRRYKFLRAPMGFISTGDSYNLRGDIALEGISHVNKVVDDTLIDDPTYAGLMDRTCDVLERYARYGITLNSNKCKFAMKEVDFVGYKIRPGGYTADPKKLDAIAQFPTPTNRTELRSFLGLVNQLGSFSSSISRHAVDLRDLLSTRRDFVWTTDHGAAFTAVKASLVSPPILALFDPAAETVLETDASRTKGLGFALLQKQHDKWRLIQCGSRFLQSCETRYAMVELEALAIVWATQKCRMFLAGLPHYTVITDHKPLLPIFNFQTLDAVENVKLQSYKAKLANYLFTVEWKQGKNHSIPDALSRAPVDDPSPDDAESFDTLSPLHIAVSRLVLDDDVTLQAAPVLTRQPLPDPTLSLLQEQAQVDADYQCLLAAIKADFKGDSAKNPSVLAYRKIWANLSAADGLVLFGARIVVPTEARADVIRRLHASHQGIVRTKRRARQTVYWPGLTNDITNAVQTCQECQSFRPSNSQEPLLTDPLPSRVFESVSADLFAFNTNHYLIYVDRLSGFPFISQWRDDPTSSQVISVLKHHFAQTGVPCRFRSDGGPQFKAAIFTEFLSRWGVLWCPSSPYNAQSNGHAESSVKSIKHLLAKTTNGDIRSETFLQGLLELRNTPRSEGISPSQWVYGHPLRSLVPAHFTSFAREWQKSAKDIDSELMRTKQYSIQQYNRSTRSLKPIPVGAPVLIQHPYTKRWSENGTVVSCDNRAYWIRLPSGKLKWRNRRFINRLPASLATSDDSPAFVDISKKDDQATLRRSSRSCRGPTYYGWD